MKDRSIAPRYAKVLFGLDSVAGNLERRLGDFEAVAEVFRRHPRLSKILKSPQVSLDAKKKVLRDCLKGKYDPLFMNFLFYLIQKGRLVYLSQMADEYRLMANEFLGMWEADIVTAVPMDADSETKLKEKLEGVFHKKIKINKKIDPKIIGGAILVIANEMLDWSVTGRLRKLKESLTATQV